MLLAMPVYPEVSIPQEFIALEKDKPTPPMMRTFQKERREHLDNEPKKPNRFLTKGMGTFAVGAIAIVALPFALPLELAALAGTAGYAAYDATAGHGKRMQEYERDFAEWQRRLDEINKRAEKARASAQYAAEQAEAFEKQTRSAASQARTDSESSKAPAGRPDAHLYRAIARRLHEVEVIQDRSYRPRDWSEDYAGYTPDVIVHDPVSKIWIDVEADEPWHLKKGDSTRHPSHCWDDPKEMKRDRYFTGEFKWIVIRFAESQLHSQMDSCVKLIAETLDRFRGTPTFSDRFADVPDVKPVQRWNADDATSRDRPRW
ncbi:MAG: hypothetical protein AAFY15_00510 [Cyanobacteria bacterium J06648_11]